MLREALLELVNLNSCSGPDDVQSLRNRIVARHMSGWRP